MASPARCSEGLCPSGRAFPSWYSHGQGSPLSGPLQSAAAAASHCSTASLELCFGLLKLILPTGFWWTKSVLRVQAAWGPEAFLDPQGQRRAGWRGAAAGSQDAAGALMRHLADRVAS